MFSKLMILSIGTITSIINIERVDLQQTKAWSISIWWKRRAQEKTKRCPYHAIHGRKWQVWRARAAEPSRAKELKSWARGHQQVLRQKWWQSINLLTDHIWSQRKSTQLRKMLLMVWNELRRCCRIPSSIHPSSICKGCCKLLKASLPPSKSTLLNKPHW